MADDKFSNRLIAPALLGVIAVATVAVYRAVGHFEFVNYDDYVYIRNNYHIWPGVTWAGVRWAFRTRVPFWLPLTWISHMTDSQLFGMKPGPQHLMNVAIHILASGALFLFLLRATGQRVCAAVVTALFALHPLQVESVAWLTERKNLLFGLFWFLTLWAWVKYALSGKRIWYGGALFFCMAGVLSKPMMMTIPVVLLIVDFWPLDRPFTRRLVYEKIPFGLLGAAGGAMAVAAQGYASVGFIPAGLRIENAVDTVWIYIFRTLWPFRLGVEYPFPASIPWWQPVLAGAALACTSVIAARLRRRAPWFLAGWLWYLATLLPVLGLVQTGVQASADHHMYVPLVGLSIMPVWGVAAVASRWRGVRIAAFVVAPAMCAFFAVVASQLVDSWRDTETLIGHALAVNPANYLAWTLLAKRDKEKGRMEDSRAALETVLQLRPDSAAGYELLAVWCEAEGRPDEEVQLWEQALRLEPRGGLFWAGLGVALLREGRRSEAMEKFQTAVKIAPNDPQVHLIRGIALLEKGSVEEGLAEERRAAELDPSNGSYLRSIGDYWHSRGPIGLMDAIYAYRQAVAADPLDANNHASLGGALYAMPDGRQEAIRELGMAQKLHWDAGVDQELRRMTAGSPQP